jgi:hypothetical protein
MKHRDTSGRLVLEDLPETIQQLGQIHPRIEKRAYNFFVPQPMCGKPRSVCKDLLETDDYGRSPNILHAGHLPQLANKRGPTDP